MDGAERDRIEGDWVTIPARSHREAMDWSLVLASQEIPAMIDQGSPGGWTVSVERGDLDRALKSIGQFRLENRRWRLPKPLTLPQFSFDPAAAVWVLTFAAVHWVLSTRFPGAREWGVMDSEAVRAGEWWRFFTAVWLHVDLAHLMANSTMGFLFMGLAMAHYGTGLAALGGLLAGMAGNLAGFLLYTDPYRSVGASGMVMGALGMLAVHSFRYWRGRHLPVRAVLRASLAGVLLFVLIGLNPSSDVLAHIGGFFSGLLIGAAALALPVNSSKAAERTSWLLFYGLAIGSWTLAVTGH